MKKRVALIISLLIIGCLCAGLSLVCACSNKSGGHEHKYSAEWSAKDAYSHWHAATCGHTDLGVDEEPHDIGDDYRCKVCGYTLIPTEGLLHELNEDGRSYSIVGVDRYLKDTDIVIPLQYDGLPVTAISKGAFSERSTLKSIRIPVTVTSIGANAFYDCAKLIDITIPNYVTSIGAKAFYGCSSLETLKLGSSITRIDADAFAHCSNLKEVNITNLEGWCDVKLGSLSSSPFNNGADMYIDDELIEDLVIPGTITKLEQNVFYNVTLSSLTLPDSIIEIRNNAFYEFSVDSVKYTGSVENWCQIIFANNYANPLWTAENFYSENKKITELELSGIDIVEQYAFCGYKGLTSLQLKSLASIGDSAFSDCVNITDLTISNSVININNGAFSNCFNLKNIEFGNNVKNIDTNAFLNCRLLTKIVLPNSVNDIGEGAFKNCASLVSVTLSEELKSVGTAAFEGCHKLVELYNLSALDVAIGTESYGSVGLYALDIYNSIETESKLITTDGFIFYNGTEEIYLLGYIGSSGTLTLPDNVNGKDYGIYSYAFNYCDNLSKIVIPASILSIGVSAFDNCKNLLYNEYQNGLYLSLGSNNYGIFIKVKDKNVTSATISEETKIIADSAFSSAAIQSITIPGNVASLGDRAFEYCVNLKNVTFENGLKSIGYRTFYSCSSLEAISLPDSLISIGNSAFFGCSNLKNLVISDSIKKIGTTPFEGCPINEASIPATAILSIPKSYLQTVNVTSGEKIEERAFYNATKLSTISLPDTINWVGQDAFGNCTSLIYYEDEKGTYLGNSDNHYLILILAKDKTVTEFTLAEKTKIIYDKAFMSFSNLNTINLEGIYSIGYCAFYWCSALTNVNLAEGATYIGNQAFRNCSNLKSITMPDSVTYIGSQAFYDCSKLTSITIPKGVTEILKGTFRACSALTQVVLHDNIEYIGNDVFTKCSNLAYNFYNGANYLGTAENKYMFLIKASDGATSCVIHDDAKYICLDAFNNSSIAALYIGTRSNPYLFLRKCDSKILSPTVNERTEYVGDYAFTTVKFDYNGNEADSIGTFIKITLSASVKYIGENAFKRNLENLKSVYIGGNVKRIETGVFNHCMYLSNIYYDGTYAQWNSIVSGSIFDYNTSYYCGGLTLHCTDGNYKII